MLDLPDDFFSHLFQMNYPSFKNISPLFSTCNKLNLLSNLYIINIIKKDYKLLVRNYYVKSPKRIYNSIYKIYGNKFVLEK